MPTTQRDAGFSPLLSLSLHAFFSFLSLSRAVVVYSRMNGLLRRREPLKIAWDKKANREKIWFLCQSINLNIDRF